MGKPTISEDFLTCTEGLTLQQWTIQLYWWLALLIVDRTLETVETIFNQERQALNNFLNRWRIKLRKEKATTTIFHVHNNDNQHILDISITLLFSPIRNILSTLEWCWTTQLPTDCTSCLSSTRWTGKTITPLLHWFQLGIM